MFQSIHSVAICGMEGIPIRVEADVRDGFPSFEMVGFLSGQVREAAGRVRAALTNAGFPVRPQKICINLAPASVKKEGNAFDLPIAIAILSTMIPMSKEKLNHTMFVGELGLDGSVKRIPGVLSMVCSARDAGMRCCVVPFSNQREASVLSGIRIIGIRHLQQLAELLQAGDEWPEYEENIQKSIQPPACQIPDFSEVIGQQSVKHAIEIAVSGRHHFLMIGSAGSGKTMLAKRIPSIMPPMSEDESLELSRIYSVSGLLTEEQGLMKERPFRSPHHTTTKIAMTGGGRIPRAGEISLAHKGVLFLDELPEFAPDTLDILRQPMEEHSITLTRSYATISYPADFLVVAAMNPCKCGYYPDRNRCKCNGAQVQKYLNRVSGPLLDRIDLVASVEPVLWTELDMNEESGQGQKNTAVAESSAQIRERVSQVWKIQQRRFAGTGISCNSQMGNNEIKKYCMLGREERKMMEQAFDKLGISLRGYHKILKVARTIADMQESDKILCAHLSEAICYRSNIHRFWE